MVEDIAERREPERGARTIDCRQVGARHINETSPHGTFRGQEFRRVARVGSVKAERNALDRPDANMWCKQRAGNASSLRRDDRAAQKVVRQDCVNGLLAKRIRRVAYATDRQAEHEPFQEDVDFRPEWMPAIGVWWLNRRRPPSGRAFEACLHRLLPMCGGVEETNAMAPPPRPARGCKDGFTFPGLPQEVRRKFSGIGQCSLPVRRSASDDDTLLSHDISSVAADMWSRGPAPSRGLERRYDGPATERPTSAFWPCVAFQ
jgi:hypothetical protein